MAAPSAQRFQKIPVHHFLYLPNMSQYRSQNEFAPFQLCRGHGFWLLGSVLINLEICEVDFKLYVAQTSAIDIVALPNYM